MLCVRNRFILAPTGHRIPLHSVPVTGHIRVIKLKCYFRSRKFCKLQTQTRKIPFEYFRWFRTVVTQVCFNRKHMKNKSIHRCKFKFRNATFLQSQNSELLLANQYPFKKALRKKSNKRVGKCQQPKFAYFAKCAPLISL